MADYLTLALVQAPAYGDPPSFDARANLADYLERIDEACRRLSPALVVLPELFTTPYFCSSHDPGYRDLAEPIPGPVTDALGELSRAHSAYITVPIFERAADGRDYDSCALVGPDGGLCEIRVVGSDEVYPAARKVHVPRVEAFGTSLDEKFWFRPGPGLAYVDTDLGRLGFLICYDRSFPEAWRTLVLAGVDLVVVPVTSSGFREAAIPRRAADSRRRERRVRRRLQPRRLGAGRGGGAHVRRLVRPLPARRGHGTRLVNRAARSCRRRSTLRQRPPRAPTCRCSATAGRSFIGSDVSLYEVMRTANATRSYARDPVDDAAIHRVLEHARFAPSGGNRQPWRVLVLRDPEAKRKLREQYVIAYRDTPAYGTPSLDRFAERLDEVPVLLLVCVELEALTITDRALDRQSIVGGASIYPFVQNVLLGLRNEGLGGLLSTLVCPREPQLASCSRSRTATASRA